MLDLRGTGDSAIPADTATYQCDIQVPDVESLRQHVGLDRIDVIAHSAGGTLALLYALRNPDRVDRLALICPSPRPVGLEVNDDDRRKVAERRRDEPWFPTAFAAFERIWSGQDTDADWAAIAPFSFARWDAVTQAHQEGRPGQKNTEAADAFYAAGAIDPDAVRSGLARLTARVLLIAGEYDVWLPPTCASEYAGLFPAAEFVVQPGAGHNPWLDDPEWFVRTVAEFLCVPCRSNLTAAKLRHPPGGPPRAVL